MATSSLSSHALDTTLGKPAAGMPVTLFANAQGEDWTELSKAATNADGRATKDNFPALAPGLYKVRFDTTTYFRQAGVEMFLYPYVDIVFQLEAGQHYHIPLLISAHGYSTYRGS